MHKVFVSYIFRSLKGTKSGIGNKDIETEGIFSINEVKRIESLLVSQIKLDLDINDDLKVIITNWQKYDPFP
jgi:hypothetical protein